MSPTKLEDYDASKDAFDTKVVYVAIEEAVRFQQSFEEHIRMLKKVAYDASRALEAERLKTQRLEAQVARWEALDAKHAEGCTCNSCTEGRVV